MATSRKILGQDGTSLADLYDVEGSIAGIEELDSRDVKTVHEMGSTILSERIGATITEIGTGALAQTVAWNINFSLGEAFHRILGIQVVTTPVDRILTSQVSITTPPQGGSDDIPVWYWDSAVNGMISIRLMQNAGVSTLQLLQPSMVPLLPNLSVGNEKGPLGAFTMSWRGITSTFGAGTATSTLIVYHIGARASNISDRGLPLPSW